MANSLDKEQLRVFSESNGFCGFSCPKTGRNESFEFCLFTCQNKCMPLPVLLSFIEGRREVNPNTYSVTEILNPPQIVYLSRNNPYYQSPNALIDAHIGTAWHEKLESIKDSVKLLGLEDEYIIEKNFNKRFINDPTPDNSGMVELHGTPDLYVTTTKTLWDFKTMKYWYTLKNITEGSWESINYHWQINMYRVLAYPEAEDMKIFAYVKDWKTNFPEKYGIDKTEIIKVPRIPDEVVIKKITGLLTEHTGAQRTGFPRQCTEDERWINRDGIALRCRDYCPVSEICPQINK